MRLRMRSQSLMQNRKRSFGAMILFVVLMAAASVASAQTYTVTDLGVLSGDTASEGLAVNSSGEVVGCADTSDISGFPCSESFPGHAFLWKKGTMQDLGVLKSDVFSQALYISDSEQVTGTSVDSLGNSAPFLWTQSTGIVPLPTLPGATYGLAGGITSQGIITGSSNSGANPSVIVPIAWIKSGNTYKILLQLPTVPGAVVTLCCYVNNSNEGAGLVVLNSGEYHGFRVKTTGATDLGTLPGGTLSNAQGINSSGVIAGYSNSSTSGSNFVTVAWDPHGKIHPLGTLPGGTNSGGYDINDSNQIVGFSNTATSASDAMIWTQKGGMKDLNNLIPPNSGWVLVLANWINNSGQITGYGTINGENRAFLLTPQ
jgi:probable HAF family extracellular repeat protein